MTIDKLEGIQKGATMMLLISLVGCTAISPTPTPTSALTPTPGPTSTPQPPHLFRSVNLGDALEAPREGEWGVTLQEEYFQLIQDAGFDSIRIPIRWSSHARTTPPYTIDEDFFDRVDWAVEQTLSRGLIAVLDMHHYVELMEGPPAHKERFLVLWRQIAEHYQDYPDTVYFELLNEPNGSMGNRYWNEFLQEAIAIVRETNRDRTIVVGPTQWNSIAKLEDLVVPADDPNIIVTFHYYLPFEFTHQGAEWVDGSARWLGTTWTGTDTQKRMVRMDLDAAAQWAAEHRRTLWLGEFGAYSKADMDSRARWTSFVTREAEARNIAWAYWEFCSGFGVYDPDTKAWRTELLRALIPDAGSSD